MSNVYKWRNAYGKVSAQTAGEEIERLCDVHGEVTPKILLDESRPEDAVMHKCYEWDDTKAAEAHRLWQSRQIIGNIILVKHEEQQVPEPVRAFVNISKDDNSRQYIPTVVALNNEETAQQIEDKCRKEIETLQRKYEAFLDFKKLLQEMYSFD